MTNPKPTAGEARELLSPPFARDAPCPRSDRLTVAASITVPALGAVRSPGRTDFMFGKIPYVVRMRRELPGEMLATVDARSAARVIGVD